MDDDPDFSSLLAEYLTLQGFALQTVQDAARVEEAIGAFSPDLILLDQRLGSISGTDVLRRLRLFTDLPCMIVTNNSETMDRIVNLELGADDEMQKTVTPREMLARIRTVLRRRRRQEEASQPSEPARPGWTLDTGRRVLRQPDGTVCPLTNAEFETLAILHASRGSPVSRMTLCSKVFGRPFRVGDRAVDTIVKNLRRKIEPAASDFATIQAVRTFGYVFVGFPEVRTPEPLRA
ncbi:response regulator transcription factor [Roseococcus sp. YIM B11640]|uniref:response regulator transcription factor n=1 Tax=Roseococcus sp. YIM B11640 TaxID=3133973 RepID=UPI003C7DF6D7